MHGREPCDEIRSINTFSRFNPDAIFQLAVFQLLEGGSGRVRLCILSFFSSLDRNQRPKKLRSLAIPDMGSLLPAAQNLVSLISDLHC